MILSEQRDDEVNNDRAGGGIALRDIVGSDCVDAVYFVAGNAVYDAEFQSRTVELMGESLPQGGCLSICHAQLIDRYLALAGQPTIYGNAFGSYDDENGECALLVSGVVDPENLDKRRARVGHTSMDAERRRCAAEAREHDWKLPSRGQSLKERKQLAIEGGYLQR